MTHVMALPVPARSPWLSLFTRLCVTGQFLPDNAFFVPVMVLVRILAVLGLMMLLASYNVPWLAVGLGVLYVAGVALDTWHELLAKPHEQRSHY